jgi:hypothetical protein
MAIIFRKIWSNLAINQTWNANLSSPSYISYYTLKPNVGISQILLFLKKQIGNWKLLKSLHLQILDSNFTFWCNCSSKGKIELDQVFKPRSLNFKKCVPKTKITWLKIWRTRLKLAQTNPKNPKPSTWYLPKQNI